MPEGKGYKNKKKAPMKKKTGGKKKLAVAAASMLLLTGCAGTVFNGLPDWDNKVAAQKFCDERAATGLSLQTAGFAADLTVGTVLAPIVNVVKTFGASAVENPTTIEINKECNPYWDKE